MLKDIVWILTSDVMEGQTVKMDQMNRKVIYVFFFLKNLFSKNKYKYQFSVYIAIFTLHCLNFLGMFNYCSKHRLQ